MAWARALRALTIETSLAASHGTSLPLSCGGCAPLAPHLMRAGDGASRVPIHWTAAASNHAPHIPRALCSLLQPRASCSALIPFVRRTAWAAGAARCRLRGATTAPCRATPSRALPRSTTPPGSRHMCYKPQTPSVATGPLEPRAHNRSTGCHLTPPGSRHSCAAPLSLPAPPLAPYLETGAAFA
jgi:hypothetical protein